MAIPATPTNFILQQGNSQVFLSWSIAAGATSYQVQRSTDGVTYSIVSSPTTNYYLDTSGTVGTNYYYQVASTNASGTSAYTTPQTIVPTLTGQMSLGELRLRAKQRADMENSNFIDVSEWNYYINQSYYELYDLLITAYEDYYIAPRLSITTTSTDLYALPNGANNSAAPAFYKLYGVDCGLSNSTSAFVTLKKFDFIQRNRYVFPQITSSILGVFNMEYRVLGSNIKLIPSPGAGQTIGLWYFPKLTTLLQDTDVVDGISGWTEYVIVDAARKAMMKEESDTTFLIQEKMMLQKRIEESASNRDAGAPDTISDTRGQNGWGSMGGIGYDGPLGGY